MSIFPITTPTRSLKAKTEFSITPQYDCGVWLSGVVSVPEPVVGVVPAGGALQADGDAVESVHHCGDGVGGGERTHGACRVAGDPGPAGCMQPSR